VRVCVCVCVCVHDCHASEGMHSLAWLAYALLKLQRTSYNIAYTHKRTQTSTHAHTHAHTHTHAHLRRRAQLGMVLAPTRRIQKPRCPCHITTPVSHTITTSAPTITDVAPAACGCTAVRAARAERAAGQPAAAPSFLLLLLLRALLLLLPLAGGPCALLCILRVSQHTGTIRVWVTYACYTQNLIISTLPPTAPAASGRSMRAPLYPESEPAHRHNTHVGYVCMLHSKIS